jgi:nicotinate-nucleotide--dimethylbenzimidazole phosphoribosyltransferase
MVDFLQNTIRMIKPLDKKCIGAACSRQDNLTKPKDSLGRLENLSIQIAGIQNKPIPQIKNKAIIIMAGDHGVVAEKVGNWPQAVTGQMVLNFLNGGAGINVLARQINARVIVVDMGIASNLLSHTSLLACKIEHGTKNIKLGPAMSEEQAVKSIVTGIQIVTKEIDKGLDIVGTGDMGIGNTTASSAICAAITGHSAKEVTGRGTGITDEQLAYKISIVEQALKINCPDATNPIGILSKLGGFEIGGLAGVMLGAAANKIPVVIDGFISGAAALIATGLAPDLKEYLIPAHVSAEKGHRLLLRYLRLNPLLDLDMRLGEGTGAALGIFLAESSVRILNEMATFNEAGVSERNT